MDNLVTPKEIDVLISQFQKSKDPDFFGETCKNTYIFYKIHSRGYEFKFSLVPKEGYVYGSIYNAIQEARNAVAIYSSVLFELKKNGSYYYAVFKGGREIEEDKKFTTKEEAVSFAEDYMHKRVDADETLKDILIIGGGEVSILRKEEYAASFPELVESIKESKYAVGEISKDMLKDEFFDCYVMECVVSYENAGWAGFLIESKAMSSIEIWKNDDRVNSWETHKKRIKNIPQRFLDEIIHQINE